MAERLKEKLRTLRAAGVYKARFDKGELIYAEFFASQPAAPAETGESKQFRAPAGRTDQVDLLHEVVLAAEAPIVLDAGDFPPEVVEAPAEPESENEPE